MLPKIMYSAFAVALMSYVIIFFKDENRVSRYINADTLMVTAPAAVVAFLAAIITIITHWKQKDVHFKIGLFMLGFFVVLIIIPVAYLLYYFDIY